MGQALDLFDDIDGPCNCGAPQYDDANCPYCNSAIKARDAIEALEVASNGLLEALICADLQLREMGQNDPKIGAALIKARKPG